MLNKNNCLICKEELHYFDELKSLKCEYCHDSFEANASCNAGHYVCDSCHSKDGKEIIKKASLENQDINPIELAIKIMKHPSIKMHGPEHHYLVPAVLLSSYYNKIERRDLLTEKLVQAEKRSNQILGGFCGFYGNCGAAVGTGIFMSLITNTKPVSKEHWGDSNRITAKSLLKIADEEGPRCCKRDTFLSLNEGVNYINEKFNVEMELSANIKCEFSHLNKECKLNACQFYQVNQQNFELSYDEI